MRFVFTILSFLVLFAVGLSGSARAAEMVLTSTDVSDEGSLSLAQVYNGFGCEGENISPALSWSGVPEAARSLAITVYDPDAPTGSGWWHWVAFNIPADTTGIASGASLKAMPPGTVESRTDYGVPGFGGACPPTGDAPHHYIFTLYALDVEVLDADENASGAMIGFFLNAHSLTKASITATYGR